MKSTTLSGRVRKYKRKALHLIQANRQGDALPLLEEICQLAPRDGEAWMMLGAVLGSLGDLEAAITCSERAVTLLPDNLAALDNLALACQRAGDLVKAGDAWQKRLSLRPGHRATVLQLVRARLSQGAFTEARQICQDYLARFSADREILCSLGNILEFEGSLSAAEACYRQALELGPVEGSLLANLGNILGAQGRTKEAIETCRRALEVDPGNASLRSNYLINLHYDEHYNTQLVFAEHVRLMQGRCGGDGYQARVAGGEGPLTVGFVSPDMRTHSVAWFLKPLLESLGGQGVDGICYADVPRPDAMTACLQGLAGRWRDISGLSTESVCRQVRDDDVDVLIDLAGHTSPRIMEIFAARPAPVQVTWLGYPNTTGLACMDYRIVDWHTDPGGDSLHTEALIRLDGCFLCYRAPAAAPPVAPLPAEARGYVTFGSFNNLSKINDRVLQIWAKLALQTEGSRLYIKNPSFTDGATRERVCNRLVKLGMERERITLVGRTASTEEHLELYRNVDIALDSFPYTGTTTTCEALWMGVPVVSLAGSAHVSRVGVSLLNALGRPEWVASDEESYIRIAASLAGDVNRLAQLRSGLRDEMRQSALCDAKGHALRFVGALQNVLNAI